MTLQPLVTLLVAVLIGFGAIGLRRFNMLKVANETIELLSSSNNALNSRIDALEQRDKERDLAYQALENKCQVLQEMVTHAAEVRTFREDYLASVDQVAAEHKRILSHVDHVAELVENLILEYRKGA